MRRLGLEILFIAVLLSNLTGCGDDDAAPPAGTDAGGGGGSDAGVGGDDASVSVDAAVAVDASTDCTRDMSGRCHALAWADSPAFPVVTDHHATFAHTTATGSRIFVAGGQANNPADTSMNPTYDTVRSAAIQLDGSLGPWEDELALPFDLAFHTVVTTETRAYLIGGLTVSTMGVFANGTTLVSDFTSEGRLGPWRDAGTASHLTAARVHTSAAVVGDRLYIVGGGGGRSLVDLVQSAAIAPDGSLGAFRDEMRLPTVRSHHALIAIDRALYVVGGFSGTTLSPAERPEILRGDIAMDGTVTWSEAGMMADPPWTHAGFVRDGMIYVVGGGDQRAGGRYIARVRRALVLADRTLGEWDEVAEDLPFARSHVHQTPVVDDRIYSIGGRDFATQESQPRVVIGRFMAEHDHM